MEKKDMTTKTATAAKPIMQRSAKLIAIVLLTAIVFGGTLLGCTKENRVEYIEFPEWTEAPYHHVEEFLYPETSVWYSELFSKDDSSRPSCSYSAGDNFPYFHTAASPGSKQITWALIEDGGADPSIHWRDISLGDSFRTVLDKLGLQDIPAGDDSLMYVTCFLYPDAPKKSNYSYRHSEPSDRITHSQAIDLHYFASDNTSTNSGDSDRSLFLRFEEDKLAMVHYERKAEELENPPLAIDESNDTDLTGVLSEWTYDFDPIFLVSDKPATLIEEDMDICGQQFPSDIFWEYSVDSHYTVAPETSFTVKHTGSGRNATYVNIWLAEYKKAGDNEVMEVWDGNEMDENGAVYREVNLRGRYYTAGHSTYLADDPSGIPAGNNLSWMPEENGIPLYADWHPDMIRLYPGESISFRLPESKEDTLYYLIFGYIDPDDPESVGGFSESVFIRPDMK